MPIYTFSCGSCGYAKEVVCKYDERALLKLTCPRADCDHYGDVLTYGVEGNQSVRINGAYELKAVMTDGSKKPVAHHRGRRRDS